MSFSPILSSSHLVLFTSVGRLIQAPIFEYLGPVVLAHLAEVAQQQLPFAQAHSAEVHLRGHRLEEGQELQS